MAQCPECEAIVDLDAEDLEGGEIIPCPECGVDLEVTNTNPVELDLAEDEEFEEEEEEDEDEEMDEDEE